MNACEEKQCYGNVNILIENIRFRGTGGRSQGNHQCEFVPGFIDTATGEIYRSRYSDGRPAPMHMLEGLPSNVVIRRSSSGSVAMVKSSIISGFIHQRRFYTREQAATAVKTLRQIPVLR